jgi:hypothetical protein
MNVTFHNSKIIYLGKSGDELYFEFIGEPDDKLDQNLQKFTEYLVVEGFIEKGNYKLKARKKVDKQ